MKRISFYFNHNKEISWNPYTIKNAGLGGNYVAIYNIAKQFAHLGHEVTIIAHVNKEDIYDNVRYRNIKTLDRNFWLQKYDLFISCESGIPDFLDTQVKINWIHRNINEAIDYENFDHHVFASEFHKRYLNTPVGEVIPNGVDIELFKQRFPKIENDISFVGHPIKGMQYIPFLAEKIREKIKEVKLHTYGDAEIWGWDQEQFIDLQQKLIKAKVLYHGRMGQNKLARFLHQSEIFLYPSTFQEPFGMAVLEAMAGGCVPITSSIGNIPKLIKDCGFVIEGLPTDFGWYTLAAEKVVELLQDKEQFKEHSMYCVERAENFDWEKIINIWRDKFLI